MSIFVLDGDTGRARRDWRTLVGDHVTLALPSATPRDRTPTVAQPNGAPLPGGPPHLLVAHRSTIQRRVWQRMLAETDIPVLIISGGKNDPLPSLAPGQRIHYHPSPVDAPTDAAFTRAMRRFLRAHRPETEPPWFLLAPEPLPEQLVSLYLMMWSGHDDSIDDALRAGARNEFLTLDGDARAWDRSGSAAVLLAAIRAILVPDR